VFSQSRDTEVIVVDKNADYIHFEDHHITTDKYLDYSAENSGQSRFTVSIKCHYLDEKPDYAWIARTQLYQMKRGYKNWKINDYEIRIKRNDLSHFKTVSAETINKTKDIMYISRLIGYNAEEDRVIYTVFKRDLRNETITLYRVAPGVNIMAD